MFLRFVVSNELDVKLAESVVAEILKLIQGFSFKWDSIGLELGFLPSELSIIRNKPLFLTSAPTSYLTELLSQWIQWPTQDHPTEPTLRALCTALRNPIVGLGSLADKVEMEMSQLIRGKGASHMLCNF